MKLIESLDYQETALREFLSRYYKKTVEKQQLLDLYLKSFKIYWSEALGTLEPLDLFLFMSTYTKEGVDIYQLLPEVDKILIQESIERLEKLCLCTQRINISHLRMSPRLYMFEEIREFFTQEQNIKSFQSFSESISEIEFLTSQIGYADVPDDVIQFFYSYGFYVPQTILEQSFTPEVIKYLNTEGFLKSVLIICTENPVETKSYFCYKLNITEWTEKNHEIQQTRTLQSQVINDLSRLVFQIQKEGLKITKRDEMSKKSLEKFHKIIPQESLLWFLLQFLKYKNYLEQIEGEVYKVSEIFLTFFKKDLKDTYNELLKTDPTLQEILNIIQGLPASRVSFADILLAYLKQHKNLLLGYMDKREIRRSLLQKVELLHYLGILDQEFTTKGISFYTQSVFYKNSYNYQLLPKPILTLSTSFQIMGDMEVIPPQVSYMLSLFGDIESLSPALAFKIDQNTFHRALYFGFHMGDLMEILNNYSKTAPDSFIIQSLELWTRNFKSGQLQEGIVLFAPAEILDELEFKPEYAIYIKKRISPEYALVSSELKAKKILEKSYLYFFTKIE